VYYLLFIMGPQEWATPFTAGNMIRVYLAGHYSRKNAIRRAAFDLTTADVEVVSTWHEEKFAPNVSIVSISDSFLRRAAKRDRRELRQATHFVFFSVDPDFRFTRGGHCWENGYADGLGLKVVVVGPRQHIFHYLKGRKHISTWEHALEWLIKKNRKQ
jgi:hypothetical protein